jgi:tetratricopeptide (TPR) repeat protein
MLSFLLIGIPLSVRLLCHLQLSGQPFYDCLFIDSRLYHLMGVGLAQASFHYPGPFWQPPLYPYFLGLIYALAAPNPEYVRFTQMVLGSVSCLLVFQLGDRLFGRAAAWIAWAAMALWAPLIFFDLQILNVSLAVFLFLLFLRLLVASGPLPLWRSGAAGLCAGLASITVGNMMVVAPLAALWLLGRGWVRRQGVGRLARSASLLLLAWLIPIGVVTAANWARSGEPVVVSYNAGINFWIGNNPDYEKTVGIRPGRAWENLAEEPRQAGITGYQASSRYFFGKSLHWAGSHPAAFLGLLARKTDLFLRGDEIARNQEIYPFRKWSSVLRALLWIGPVAFPFGILLPIALAGMVTFWLAARARKRTEAGRPSPEEAPEFGRGFLALLIGVYALSVILFFVTSRYRLPVVPLLLLFAAGGIVSWVKRIRTSSGPSLAVPAIVLILAGLISNTGLPSMPDSFHSDAYYDLGLYYHDRGQTKTARSEYERALELDPKNAEALNNLAGLDLSEGDLEGARGLLEKLVVLYPEDPTIHQNLGLVYSRLGRPILAGYHYLKVEEARPGDSEIQARLAQVEEQCSRLEAERMAKDPQGFLDAWLARYRAEPGNEFLYRRLVPLLRSAGRDADVKEIDRLRAIAVISANQ